MELLSPGIVGRGDQELCSLALKIIEAGGIPIVKPKHGSIEWYKERKVVLIPWGARGAVPGGFVTDLSDELVNRIVRAPRGRKTATLLEYCKIRR